MCSFFFFFNDTATTEIYTLSLHDALPISGARPRCRVQQDRARPRWQGAGLSRAARAPNPPGPPRHVPLGSGRSEEHTSELQSQSNLVCRLLLEKKKKKQKRTPRHFLYYSL